MRDVANPPARVVLCGVRRSIHGFLFFSNVFARHTLLARSPPSRARPHRTTRRDGARGQRCVLNRTHAHVRTHARARHGVDDDETRQGVRQTETESGAQARAREDRGGGGERSIVRRDRARERWEEESVDVRVENRRRGVREEFTDDSIGVHRWVDEKAKEAHAQGEKAKDHARVGDGGGGGDERGQRDDDEDDDDGDIERDIKVKKGKEGEEEVTKYVDWGQTVHSA